MLTLCQWIASTWLSVWLSGSTWGVPIMSALHVLAIAWFGGAILLHEVHPVASFGLLSRAGIGMLVVTGVLLFWSQPVRTYRSEAFLIKLALLAGIVVIGTISGKGARYAALVLWAAVVLASRGIAYF